MGAQGSTTPNSNSESSLQPVATSTPAPQATATPTTEAASATTKEPLETEGGGEEEEHKIFIPMTQ